MLNQTQLSWQNAPPNISEDMVGFVYNITELDTGMAYIGIKKFWKRKSLPPLKGKKNKRHTIVESDWKTYNSSCKELKAKIECNPQNYTKYILFVCKSVSDMKIREAYIQLTYYMNNEWNELYNEMINLRIRIRK